MITDSVTGMIIAAATPATIRAISSMPVVVARPAITLANENSTRPDTRTGLRPHRSPIAPIGRRRAASAIV